MSNIPLSRESLNPVQDYPSLDSISVDIMFIFNIVNGIVISSDILSLIGFRIPLKHTCNFDLLMIRFYKTNRGNFSFLPQALQLANNIPTSLNFFNRTIFKFNSLLYLKSQNLY